jgi:hypothetical protein
MTTEQAFFIFATTCNVFTAFWVVGALFTDRMSKLPGWHKVGLSVGALGLLAQAFRNIEFLLTGNSMTDSQLPLWFLKDFGYTLIAFHSVVLICQGRLQMNGSEKDKT